jgi:hypothetical protein
MQLAKVQELVNVPEKVIRRNVIFEVECVNRGACAAS